MATKASTNRKGGRRPKARDGLHRRRDAIGSYQASGKNSLLIGVPAVQTMATAALAAYLKGVTPAEMAPQDKDHFRGRHEYSSATISNLVDSDSGLTPLRRFHRNGYWRQMTYVPQGIVDYLSELSSLDPRLIGAVPGYNGVGIDDNFIPPEPELVEFIAAMSRLDSLRYLLYLHNAAVEMGERSLQLHSARCATEVLCRLASVPPFDFARRDFVDMVTSNEWTPGRIAPLTLGSHQHRAMLEKRLDGYADVLAAAKRRGFTLPTRLHALALLLVADRLGDKIVVEGIRSRRVRLEYEKAAARIDCDMPDFESPYEGGELVWTVKAPPRRPDPTPKRAGRSKSAAAVTSDQHARSARPASALAGAPANRPPR